MALTTSRNKPSYICCRPVALTLNGQIVRVEPRDRNCSSVTNMKAKYRFRFWGCDGLDKVDRWRLFVGPCFHHTWCALPQAVFPGRNAPPPSPLSGSLACTTPQAHHPTPKCATIAVGEGRGGRGPFLVSHTPESGAEEATARVVSLVDEVKSAEPGHYRSLFLEKTRTRKERGEYGYGKEAVLLAEEGLDPQKGHLDQGEELGSGCFGKVTKAQRHVEGRRSRVSKVFAVKEGHPVSETSLHSELVGSLFWEIV